MKVSELSGALLDYWVAKAEGIPEHGWRPPYSGDWAHGGPIIEREFIAIEYEGRETWLGRIDMGQKSLSTQLYTMRGPTPLVAAMRTYVASKFGDEVSD